MIKLIEIDFDDTAVRTVDAVYNSYKDMCEQKNLQMISFEEFLSFTGGPVDLEKVLGVHPIVESEWINTYEKYVHLERIFEDTNPILSYWKENGFKIALVSSASWKRIHSSIRKFGIDQYLDHIVSSKGSMKAKPDPAVLIAARKEFGLDPSECIYIGDSIADVKAANADGMMSIGLRRGIRKEDYFDGIKPNAVFDHLIEAQDYVMGLR